MKLDVVDERQLPFLPGATEPRYRIEILSAPRQEKVADNADSITPWFDLEEGDCEYSTIIEPSEIVLHAKEARLVLVYPFAAAVVRRITPDKGTTFSRLELVKAISETYREVYRMEQASADNGSDEKFEPHSYNRRSTHGAIGIWGHQLRDLAISSIDVIEVAGDIWLNPGMES